jgi:hypothetical protein
MVSNRISAVQALTAAGFAPRITTDGDIIIDDERTYTLIMARARGRRGPRRVSTARVIATVYCPTAQRRRAALEAARRLIQALRGLERVEVSTAQPVRGAAVWTPVTGWRPLPVQGPKGRLP